MSTAPERGLRNAWQGALAGGGDPASSPLYVFGPFLTLVVGAGVADVTFGASIWLAVLTITVVSLLYRLVMRWIVDGSGGTGLAEEELGSWAAKITAALTCIEYTLTFLVSIAALVTFIGDRVGLDHTTLGVDHRAWLAVSMSALCGGLVSRGPRVVSRALGPATGAVLVLLWVMIVTVVARRGLHLAPFDLQAFDGRHLGYTLGGFVRILALMTGIEVFANLVVAYAGPPVIRSRKAFTSLAIIMGSTAITMVVVGPAILALADPENHKVSVFTQTMDALLPRPLALAGTVAGVLVLLSAAAASSLGIQSLFLGLSVRNYAPAALGVQNRFGIAARPVWLEASIAAVLFVALGTREATYLAIYAAGVFVLLSMTGWAAVLRLSRRRRAGADLGLGTRAAVLLAALFTSAATVVIFYERFRDGVWLYALLVPVIAGSFSGVRSLRGDPGAAAERMGRLVAARGLNVLLPLGVGPVPSPEEITAVIDHLEGVDPDPKHLAVATVYRRRAPTEARWRVCVPLDGSAHAELALPFVVGLARERSVALDLLYVGAAADEGPALDYLALVAEWIAPHVQTVSCHAVEGEPADEVLAHLEGRDISILVLTTHGRSGIRRAVAGSVTRDVLARATRSTVAVRVAHP